MIFPTEEAFVALHQEHTLIPVAREIVADDLTPVLAFSRLRSEHEHKGATFLLESVTGGEKWARYSFVGCDPDYYLRGRGDLVEITDARGTTSLRGVKPFEHLRALLSGLDAARIPGLPRFFGGAVGYLGWEAIRHFEPKALVRPSENEGWDFSFAVGGPVIAFDQVRQVAQVIVPARIGASDDPRAAYRRATAQIEDVLTRLAKPSALSPLSPPQRSDMRVPSSESSFTKDAFEAAVLAAQEHIKAGDIFQAVLSQRFQVPTDGSDLFDAYRRLRVLNPSPYMFYVSLPEAKLAGASPETLVRLEGGVAEVRPIAGTRPRGATDADDRRLADELLADPKERAEHVMLVDLGRNDLGRVCKPGTVKVAEELTIERYSHVLHIVSSVVGELEDDKDAIDLLAATFPAGTLSGAPKVRAIQIIEALEPTSRGLYGGAVGYLGWDGNLDLAIAIRTIVETRGQRSVQAGAGVVEASVPSSEYQETINKARAALSALR